MTPDLTTKLDKLKGERTALVKQGRDIIDKADPEKGLSAEQQQEYARIEKDIDSKGEEIRILEKQNRVEEGLGKVRDGHYRPNASQPEDETAPRCSSDAYKKAFFNKGGYARVSKSGLTAEHLNALSEGVDAQGGFLVPHEFEMGLIEILVNNDPITAGADVQNTAADRDIPVEEDFGSFSYIGEGGTFTENDPSIGRVVLGAWKHGGIVKVSEELVQDATFDIAGYLQRVAGRRYNDTDQTSFANGNGASKPLGLFQTEVVGSKTVQGVTGAVSATAAITFDNVIDTFHTLPRAYRRNATWITSDALVKLLRKIKDSDGQYIWQPAVTADTPDRLLNRPIEVSDGAPDPAASGKSLVLCDLAFYRIVNRLGTIMQTLFEKYAETGQVGYRFARRHDGKLTSHRALVYFKHGAAST